MEASLGKRIKDLREAFKLSQEELAQKLEMDRGSLSLIENDKRSIKASELILLANALNISIDELLNLKTSMQVIFEESKKTKRQKKETRITVPKKNLNKFKEALIYILAKVGAKPNIGETVLYKLLYFIDFDYYEKYEEHLIGATYIKDHLGPTPLEFSAVVADMIENKDIEVFKSKHFQHLQKKYFPYRKPDLSIFSVNEIKLIDDVLNKLSDMSASTISEYAHHDTPWIVTSDQKKIDYNSVLLRDLPYSVRGAEDQENN